MKRAMSADVGVFRDRTGLARAVETLGRLKERYASVSLGHSGAAYNYDLADTIELGGMLDIAEATALAALEREESRGSHFRTDFRGRDDGKWLKHSLAFLQAGGPPRMEHKDVVVTKYPPVERRY